MPAPRPIFHGSNWHMKSGLSTQGLEARLLRISYRLDTLTEELCAFLAAN